MPESEQPAKPSPWSPGNDPKAVLALLERRRLAIDQVMWQAPALVVAAQSFLFLAALNSSFPEWGRVAVLIAGLFAVIAAAHSLTKQRYLEKLHSLAIRRCLGLLGYPNIYRDGLGSLKPTAKLYDQAIVTFPSFRLWLVTFFVFGCVDVFILTKTIFG